MIARIESASAPRRYHDDDYYYISAAEEERCSSRSKDFDYESYEKFERRRPRLARVCRSAREAPTVSYETSERRVIATGGVDEPFVVSERRRPRPRVLARSLSSLMTKQEAEERERARHYQHHRPIVFTSRATLERARNSLASLVEEEPLAAELEGMVYNCRPDVVEASRPKRLIYIGEPAGRDAESDTVPKKVVLSPHMKNKLKAKHVYIERPEHSDTEASTRVKKHTQYDEPVRIVLSPALREKIQRRRKLVVESDEEPEYAAVKYEVTTQVTPRSLTRKVKEVMQFDQLVELPSHSADYGVYMSKAREGEPNVRDVYIFEK